MRGRRILITGATGGIGRAAALMLRQQGAELVLHGCHRADVAAMANELGGNAVCADLTSAHGVADLVEQAGEIGRVDVLVHCAGAGMRGLFTLLPAERLEDLLALNLHAPLQLARSLLPSMLEAGSGHLAFVGSIAGLTGVPLEAGYAAAKAGLLAFARSLRLELAGSGVGVSTVSPAAVDTGFWSARGTPYHRSTPRMMSASRVAEELIHGVERGGGDCVLPRWLRAATLTHAASPRLYDSLARRMDRA